MQAREFLAQRGVDVEVRNLFRERLTVDEILSLGSRVGGVRELVAPTKRTEVASLTDAQMAVRLADEPRLLRRPIIDTGGNIYLGFTKAVREALS